MNNIYYEDLNFKIGTDLWYGHYWVDVPRVDSIGKRIISMFIANIQYNRPAFCYLQDTNIRICSPQAAQANGYTGTVRVYYTDAV